LFPSFKILGGDLVGLVEQGTLGSRNVTAAFSSVTRSREILSGKGARLGVTKSSKVLYCTIIVRPFLTKSNNKSCLKPSCCICCTLRIPVITTLKRSRFSLVILRV
jgi:hypothetical protein